MLRKRLKNKQKKKRKQKDFESSENFKIAREK